MKLCSDMSKPRRAGGGGVFRGGTDIGGSRPPGLLAACIMGLGGFLPQLIFYMLLPPVALALSYPLVPTSCLHSSTP